MSNEALNEVPSTLVEMASTVAEIATVSSKPEMVSKIDSSFVTQCLDVLNMGASSLVTLCENIGISLEKMILTFRGAVYIVIERIKTFVYNCIYNLTLYFCTFY